MGKILLLARTFPPPDGGAERRYANLCRSFPGGSIEVNTSWRERHDEFDRAQPYPIHRMRVPAHGERRPRGFTRWLAWTLRRAARGDIGVIWAGDLRPIARIAWLVRRFEGIPYGISFYGIDLTAELHRPEPRAWKRFLAPRVFDGASFFLANSRHIAERAHEYAAQIGARPLGARLRVIRSGVDLERFRTDQDPARLRRELGLDAGRTILTVARLAPIKGVDTALRAFALVANDYPDTTYVIAGGGPLEAELRTLARSLGVEERVRIVGAVPYERMPELHAAAEVFLLTSRHTPRWTENFPNACLEAMASAKPVVAGKVGGLPEMVAHGETGLLVDPEDPAAIAAALRRLLGDAALRSAMGAAGRARVERELAHETVAREIYGALVQSSRLPLPPWHRGDRVELAGETDRSRPGGVRSTEPGRPVEEAPEKVVGG